MFDDNDLRAELKQAGSVAKAEIRADQAVQQATIHRPCTATFKFLLQHQRDMLGRNRPPRFVGGGNPADEAAFRELAIQYAVRRLRLPKETVAVYGWLVTLAGERLIKLEGAAARGGRELLDTVREIASDHPILARWAEEQKAWSDAIDAANASAAAAHHARWQAEAPTRAIAAAEGEGALLSLDTAGKRIVAQAGHGMSPATLAELREHKEAVVAILAARAAAAAPVVIV